MYNVHIEYFSYKSKKLNISDISRDFNIGVVELEIDTKNLGEIDIVAERKMIKITPNKIEYNIDKDISSSGKYASEILNNIPSVSVDSDGNISLRGQSSVAVMINGKTSSMSSWNALNSLPAGSIEKIEVISNPGAKYAASGLGVINIILKKGTNEGLNASVTNSVGHKDYYGGLLTLNHKSDNLNFYTNSTYFHRNPIKVSSSENEYFNNVSSSKFVNESSKNDNKGKGFYTTIGIDYYISPKTTIGGSINYQNINNTNDSRTFTDFLDANQISNSANDRAHLSLFDNDILEFTVEYEHNFEKEGRNLSSYITFSKDVETYNNNILNSNDSFTDENYIEKNKLKNTILDVTFSNPIKDNLSYEIGYNGEFGKIPFTISNSTLNSDIDYTENIHAFFAEIANDDDKWSYNIGLRAEFSESKINYSSANPTLIKNYDDLFPSLSLSYSINDNQNLNLSFGKNIIRPYYRILQPFEQKVSETSSYIGNENIDPIYATSLNLSYLRKMDKITFSPSLFYTKYNDFWEDVTYETGELINGIEKIVTTPFNVGKVNRYGLNITTEIKTSNTLSFTGNILLFAFDQSGTFEIINSNNKSIRKIYDKNTINGSYSLLINVVLKDIIDLQTNIRHEMATKAPFYTLKDNTYASFSLNKDLFNNNASLGITVDDIFKSSRIRRDRFDSNYFSKSLIEPKNRTIIMSFTYRFNQNKTERKIDFDKKINDPNY